MRKGVVIGALALLAGIIPGSVFAMDEVGSPVATLKPGEFAVGAEGTYSERVFDVDIDVFGITFEGSTRVRRTAFRVVAAAGVIENVEVFVKVGGSYSDLQDAPFPGLGGERPDFSGEMEPSVGVGVRVTLPVEVMEGLKFGATAQANYHRLQDVVSDPPGSPFGLQYDLDVDALEVTVAAGASLMLEPVTLYAGGFANWMYVHEDFKVLAGGVPGAIAVDVDGEPDGVLGVFLGACTQPVEGLMLSVDAHFMDGGWGVGGGVKVKV